MPCILYTVYGLVNSLSAPGSSLSISEVLKALSFMISIALAWAADPSRALTVVYTPYNSILSFTHEPR